LTASRKQRKVDGYRYHAPPQINPPTKIRSNRDTRHQIGAKEVFAKIVRGSFQHVWLHLRKSWDEKISCRIKDALSIVPVFERFGWQKGEDRDANCPIAAGASQRAAPASVACQDHALDQCGRHVHHDWIGLGHLQ
jgi:hypothetical protein